MSLQRNEVIFSSQKLCGTGGHVLQVEHPVVPRITISKPKNIFSSSRTLRARINASVSITNSSINRGIKHQPSLSLCQSDCHFFSHFSPSVENTVSKPSPLTPPTTLVLEPMTAKQTSDIKPSCHLDINLSRLCDAKSKGSSCF